MSAITQTEVITTNYLIEPNPQYDFNHKASDVYVLQNIAEDVNFNEVATSSVNKFQLDFKVDPANQFLSRGFTLNLNIPLKFTRTTAGADAGETDYVDKFFDKYTSFAWKQFGFLNAIQSITLSLDSGFNYVVTDVAEMLKIVSRYYKEDVVHQRIPASMPDCMVYENYNESSTYVQTISLENAKMYIAPTVMKTHSPFGNMGHPDYNTRQPMITYKHFEKESKTLIGTIQGETCFIPFSIFGIQGLDTQPLIGVKSMNIKINLKSNWWKHMFCTKSNFIASVEFDDKSIISGFKASLRYRTYNPPQYIDQAHGLSLATPDYNMKFQVCELQNTTHSIDFVPSATSTDSQTVPVLSYKIRALPKAIYIAAVLKAGSDDEILKTADVFARIDGMHIEVAGKKTILPNSPSGLMEIAKANGYQDSMEIGYYLGGFPLKLNMTDDLAAKTNSLVGSSNNIQNEVRISNLRLTNVAMAGKACSYEIKVVFVYDGLLTYRNGKFILSESLLEGDSSIDVSAHVSELYNSQIDGANMIGGSFGSLFAAAVPTLKKLGKGAFNVIKRYATDKQFRSQVADAYNGIRQASGWKPENSVEKVPRQQNFVEQSSGGRSSHVPQMGGFSNQIGGKEIYHSRPIRYTR